MPDYLPPEWLQASADTYKRYLNKKANTHRKRDAKRGGTYRVKEAMDAIHAAFHASDGRDPYDGMPMDGGLLGTDSNEASKAGRTAYKKQFSRLPTVDHVNGEPVCEFEIVSWQTNDAKGDMTPQEYIAHCKAVVSFRGGAN